jgi:hypothetical protein
MNSLDAWLSGVVARRTGGSLWTGGRCGNDAGGAVCDGAWPRVYPGVAVCRGRRHFVVFDENPHPQGFWGMSRQVLPVGMPAGCSGMLGVPAYCCGSPLLVGLGCSSWDDSMM